jgi:hypothetical protein
MKIQLHVNDVDEELLMRVMEIRLADKSITTPIKSLNRTIPVAGLNEIFHRIDLEKLSLISSDTSVEMKFNTSARRERKDDMINLFFLSYREKKVPGKNAMSTLADLQYVNSDIAIMPLCPEIIKSHEGEDLIRNFILYIDEYIKIIETLNNKTIVGILPARLPRQYLPDVLEAYHSHNITSFVIDSDGSSLYSNPSWIKALQRGLHSLGILDDGFIYNMNSFEGRFSGKANVTLARDFVTLTFGMDILGANHKPSVIPAERRSKMDNMQKGARLFDPQTYGYTRDPSLEKNTARMRNLLAQHKEALSIQRVINEEGTASSYFQRKTQVMENKVLDRVRDVKTDLIESKMQRSLFDNFE